MLNISLTLDHRYFNLGFENQSVAVVLDLTKYSYYALTEDMQLIDVMYQPPMSIGLGERMNVLIDPKATIYRLPQEHMGPCPFWFTNESIPVDKLEFYETTQTYYGKYCALWKPTMRPPIPDNEKAEAHYSSVHRGPSIKVNKNKIQNFKGSEMLSNIITTLEIEERLAVTFNSVSLIIRDSLEPLVDDANSIWASPWTQNKTTQYLFLDGDDVVCNDLATLKRNPSFNAKTTPWLAVLDTGYGSLVINFNTKAYESRISLLKDLFPNFKAIELTKDKSLSVAKSLSTAKVYPEVVKELAAEFMGDAKSIQAIVYNENGYILDIGRIYSESVDNLYIRNIVASIPDAEEREKLAVEVVALLHGTNNGYGY